MYYIYCIYTSDKYCIIYHYISCIHISGWCFGTCVIFPFSWDCHDPPPWSGCTRQAMDSGYPIIPTFHGSNAQTHGSTCLVVNCCPKMQKLWVMLPLCPEMPWIFVARHEKWKCSKDAPETLSKLSDRHQILSLQMPSQSVLTGNPIHSWGTTVPFSSGVCWFPAVPGRMWFLGRLIQTMSGMSGMSETNLGIAGVA